jgi:hypothetical protein
MLWRRFALAAASPRSLSLSLFLSLSHSLSHTHTLTHTHTQEDKEWTPRSNTRMNRYFWCIEDPFETTHNLGRVADKDSLFTMRGELMRAAKLLTEGFDIDACFHEFLEERSKPPPK